MNGTVGRAARLLDRMGWVGLHEAAMTEVREELHGREHLEELLHRAVLGVPARWRAVADALDPTSTLRAPLVAAADELETILGRPAGSVLVGTGQVSGRLVELAVVGAP